MTRVLTIRRLSQESASLPLADRHDSMVCASTRTGSDGCVWVFAEGYGTRITDRFETVGLDRQGGKR